MDTFALILAADAPVKKDVVTGALAAEAALAGLLLVFLGVIGAAYAAYPSGTPPSVLTRYRIAAGVILAVFFLSLTSAALSLLWLTGNGGGGSLYDAVLVLFFLQLACIFVVGIGTTYTVVLR